jgi:hypothetical protein
LAFSHAWLTAFLVRVPLSVVESNSQDVKSFSFDTIENGIASKRSVNAAARDEIKKQFPYCHPCIAQVGSQPQPQPKPTPVPQVQVKQANNSNLDLFVGSDAQSQQLLKWFNSDPDLLKLKSSVNFQAYGAGNSLYKTRYASIIPESLFPAIVFTRPDGGHIHLASKDQIPSTAKELFEDLKQSFRLMQSVYSPSPAKQTTEAPVSFPDCVDGNCPVPDPANRKPLFPNLRPSPIPDGNLFPADQTVNLSLIEGLFRRSGYSLETVFLIVAVIVAVVIYKLR